MAATIDELQIEIQASATKASSAIDMLAASLARLRTGVKGGSGLTTTTNQLKKFTDAINQMSVPSEKIAALVDALRPLESIGKSNLGSALNQLKKIPGITAGLDDAKLSEFAAKIVQVTDAVRPLAVEMEKVSAGFSKLPANIQRAINANARLTSSNYRASNSFFKLSAIMAKVYVVKRIADVIGGWIKESNDYVENLNLFTVAMGEYAESAKKYAEQVQEAVGIDASEFMRYQGIFMNMARGFGVAADKAALMSKNLTQLGYDLASLYNVKFDTAMEKLESALSGQPRPMREWGFDLSEATLKAKALELGIKKNVELMSQAEKSQIRYVQLLDTARKIGATGDFARTLGTSANQLRVLQAQATLAARALGNIFIPALNAILPYAIAFLKVVRMVAQSLASLFGFSMPVIDYSGLTGLAGAGEDAEGALTGAGKAAKKLKGMLAGFDELNIITQQPVGGGGGGGGGIGGGDLGIVLPEYDFLGGVISSQVDAIVEKMMPAMKTILGMALDIGIALLAWNIGKNVVNGIAGFLELAKNFPKLAKASKVATGLLIAIVGVKWSYEGGLAIGQGKAEFMDVVKAILGPIAAGVGGALIGSAIPGLGTGVGFVIGLTVGVLAELKGIVEGTEAARVVDTFTNSMKNAGVPIEEFARAATNAFKEIGGVSSIVAGYGQTILDQNAKIDEAKIHIDTYMGTWQATGEITTTEIGAIITELDLLLTASETKLDAAARALSTTLVAALKSATAETTNTYNGLLSMIYLLESNGNTVIAGWRTELYNAEQALIGLDEASATYQADAAALMGQISNLTIKIYGLGGESQSVTGNLEDLNAAVNKIDFSNLSDSSGTAQRALDDLTSVATTAYTDASAAYKANQNSLDEMFRYIDTSSPRWKAIYDEALRLGLDPSTAFGDTETVKTWMAGYYKEIYEAEVAQIDALFMDTYGVIAKSLTSAIEQAALASDPTITDKDFWTRTLFEGFAYAELNEDQRQQIADQMTGAFEFAVNQVTKTLSKSDTFGPLFTALETSVNSVQSARALAGAGGAMAESLVGGVSGGLTNPISQALAKQGLNKLAGLIEEFGYNAFDAHSPAGLTVPHGEYLTAGITTGMIDNISEASVETAMNILGGMITTAFDTYFKVNSGASLLAERGRTIVDDLASGIRGAASNVKDAFESLFDGVKIKLPHFSFSGSFNLEQQKVPTVKVSWYASGGYPVPGELFIARESGPEMVGTMGGRTAVANQGSIEAALEAAISRGFAASGAGGGDITVPVYIDGELIETHVTRRQDSKFVRSNGRA